MFANDLAMNRVGFNTWFPVTTWHGNQVDAPASHDTAAHMVFSLCYVKFLFIPPKIGSVRICSFAKNDIYCHFRHSIFSVWTSIFSSAIEQKFIYSSDYQLIEGIFYCQNILFFICLPQGKSDQNPEVIPLIIGFLSLLMCKIW